MSSLFILNMSILSTLKISLKPSSQMISFLFSGFCMLFALMWFHSCFTVCGRDSLSTLRSADRGSLGTVRVEAYTLEVQGVGTVLT